MDLQWRLVSAVCEPCRSAELALLALKFPLLGGKPAGKGAAPTS